MKCPVCGREGHPLYNGWCEDCYADRQPLLWLPGDYTLRALRRRFPKGVPFKDRIIRKHLLE